MGPIKSKGYKNLPYFYQIFYNLRTVFIKCLFERNFVFTYSSALLFSKEVF